MSWLGDFMGDLAAAVFPGSRAIVTRAVDRAVDTLVSAAGRFLESLSEERKESIGTLRSHRNAATQLAEEEAYLAAKFQRDGRRSPRDADRVDEIAAERMQLREKVGEANAVLAAAEITAAKKQLHIKTATPDEFASQVGILSTKQCTRCGGVMTLQIGNYDTATGQKFFWQCTSSPQASCERIYVKPTELAHQTSVRKPNADLDVTKSQRDSWSKDKGLVAKTAARVRSHLGDELVEMLCPMHLTPMKLLPIVKPGGLLLDSYQYTCLGVDDQGRACSHHIPLKSFGQVSALLHRTEGAGILH